MKMNLIRRAIISFTAIFALTACTPHPQEGPVRDHPLTAQEAGTKVLYEAGWITHATGVPNWGIGGTGPFNDHPSYWDSKDFRSNLGAVETAGTPGGTPSGIYFISLEAKVKYTPAQIRAAAENLKTKARQRGLTVVTKSNRKEIDTWDETHVKETTLDAPDDGIRIDFLSKDLWINVDFTPTFIRVEGGSSQFRDFTQNRDPVTGEFIPSYPVPRPPKRTDGHTAEQAFKEEPEDLTSVPNLKQ